jgi:hypothetical protein
MRSVVVHASQGNAHKYGGEIIRRAVKFNEKRNLGCVPEYLFAELSQQMFAAEPHTLCLACVDSDESVRGHAIIHVQEMYGYRTAMVYHLEIDDEARDETRMAMLNQGWDQIEEWARRNKCQAVRTWAMNETLANIFTRHGLEPKKYVFMEKNLT